MYSRVCPRCGRSFPEWQPVHLSCLLFRGRYLLGTVVVIVGLCLAAIIYEPFSMVDMQHQTADGPDRTVQEREQQRQAEAEQRRLEHQREAEAEQRRLEQQIEEAQAGQRRLEQQRQAEAELQDSLARILPQPVATQKLTVIAPAHEWSRVIDLPSGSRFTIATAGKVRVRSGEIVYYAGSEGSYSIGSRPNGQFSFKSLEHEPVEVVIYFETRR